MKKKQLKSMREYLAALEEIGEVKTINEEVDWDLEMGAIIRYCNETGSPAPLFTNVKDAKGFRALGAPAGVSKQDKLYLSRYALSIGLPATATGQDIVNALIEGRNNEPIPPVEVSNGPCKENIIKGDDVDLYKLPVPLAHMGDGGRYINTFGTIIVQTPDGKWTNWSIARIMIADKTKMTGLVIPFQHIGRVHAEWKKIGKPTPFALVLGSQPMIPIISSTPLPEGMNEVDYIGGYFGEPLELVKAEESNLLVPAEAEIVVEGTISHEETAEEGPMGEYPGYIWNKSSSQKPVYNVTSISHRDNAVLPVVVAGAPIDDDHPVMGIGGAAEILHCLREAGIPATMTWSPFETACHWLVITMPKDWKEQMNSNSEELMQKIADVVFTNKFSTIISKVVVLGDDIDPTNTDEVLWAYTTRVHPTRDLYTYTDHTTIPLVGYLSEEERINGKTTAAIYNGLAPDEWKAEDYPIRSDFNHGYPKEIQESALTKLKKAGF
ncbi:UbiD family decarboxylase [Priestia megaterium]|uniref:Pyrrole-2-carboxylic acid decarboxylase n=1 Tax=Priestia megaterium TaxID=1404 RepID=A0ABD4WSM3_PRIMG|nr:UbiD family decarboxylase [Priestia megaterium]MDD9783125.1 UbiD family decarboxylase [Priestia megaterium]